MEIEINNQKIIIEKEKTILEVAKEHGIDIPTLCYHPDLKPEGRCRVCLVEVDGKLMTSCDNNIREGMSIKTNTQKVKVARRLNIELLASNHQGKHIFEEFLKLRDLHDIKEPRFLPRHEEKIDSSSPALIRDNSKCIQCARCIQRCSEVQGVDAICFYGRGSYLEVGPCFDHKLSETMCTACGQCALVCPTGAIHEADHIKGVKKELENKSKFVVVQAAPAVRASIGEEFGMPAGTLVTGKMVSALRKLGFNKVFGTDFGADLTIMEEASELVNRIKNKGTLPLITSCSPGWVNFIEAFYPELLKHLSTCKSPHQMLGAIAKTYYAEKEGIDPKKLVVVSIMPCTAKKYEIQREELKGDVDYVLTTREAARTMKQEGINLPDCKEEEFDAPLGISSGGGAVFGVTGGVMESALRTAHYFITGRDRGRIEFNEVRGMEWIREAQVKIGSLKLNLAVAHGLGNARKILENIKKGQSKYHFIEIMACPGGCIGGGGQPKPTTKEIIIKRAEAIYQQDKELKLRAAHHNPAIKQVYKEFLGEPLGKKSHELLHTKYMARGG